MPDWVPDLVEVPASPFVMGSSDADTLADADEKPQHTLELPTYYIGRTEVTNAQFQPFVEGDGYSNPDYWTEAGWAYREAEGVTQPYYWDDSRYNRAQQPVVGISWYEAVAYVNWLSVQTGHEFRLPTEAEWEKAARGEEGRIYPWGNTWVGGLANTSETDNGSPMAVGQYPDGASFYGVLDMAGNVWEWCATEAYKNYPYTIEDEWSEGYLASEGSRILRGGGWLNEGQLLARGASRANDVNPRDGNYFYDNNVGMRVASNSSMP